MTSIVSSDRKLTKQDFVSDQMVRWCPGCGDYVALSAMQRALADLGIARENLIFVSGIGCSSRFPYYMNTYGFHSIHGRAPNFASGMKLANPNNHIWLVMGDGDALSIGANHLIHFLRRNWNVNLLILNNQIYGLTKGQCSPTSEKGKISKSTPQGNLETPLNPAALALSAKVSFYARGVDKDILGMKELFKAAELHQGTSVVEIYQNCNVFNDKAFASYTDRETKENTTILLQENSPLLYGENKGKGIVLNGLELQSIKIVTEKDKEKVLVHRSRTSNDIRLFLYGQMTENPDLPTPLGIFKQSNREVFEKQLLSKKKEDLTEEEFVSLLKGKNSWEI